MDINTITIGEAKDLLSVLGGSGNNDGLQPFEIGKAYLIRTVTHIDIGIVEKVGDKELVLSQCSWIADTGRYHNCLKAGIESLDTSEIEPYVDDVILGRGAIIDATIWRHALPREQK